MTKETIGKYRWTICALLFLATTINYLDRQVLSLLQPTLEELFGWTNTDYANITAVFQFTYAISMLFAGRVVDKMGTRRGFSVAISVWSIGAILHAFAISIGGIVGGALGLSGITAISIAGFMIGRAILAIGEAGNFPAAIKATAEYFPKKERSFATGIFNSGAGIGAVLAPITIPKIYALWGWEAAFIIVGIIGFLWLGLWLWLFKKPEDQPLLSAAELAYIKSDPEKPADTTESLIRDKEKVSWIKLLGYRQTWAFTFGKFMTDGVWWFFLFWLPAYLKAQYGMMGEEVRFPLAVLYMITMVGSIGGGWFPVYFAKKGYNIYEARMRAMLMIAVIPLVVLLAQPLGGYSMWMPVILIGIGAAAHQAWSANIFTTVSDMFPQKAIGSVVGIGGMAGGIGGVLITKLGGWLFDAYRVSGIAQSWVTAKAYGLGDYVSTIRSMNVKSKYGDRIDLDVIDFSSIAGDSLEKFRNVDPVAFDKLIHIQKPLVLAEMTTSYTIMFSICAVAYLVAWVVMKSLVPKMKLVNI